MYSTGRWGASGGGMKVQSAPCVNIPGLIWPGLSIFVSVFDLCGLGYNRKPYILIWIVFLDIFVGEYCSYGVVNLYWCFGLWVFDTNEGHLARHILLWVGVGGSNLCLGHWTRDILTVFENICMDPLGLHFVVSMVFSESNKCPPERLLDLSV